MRSKLHSQELKQQQQQQKSKFLPMLCSSSPTKEVKVSHCRCSSSSSSASASVSISEDPSSPRVGCMGQVKRNNKVVGFPSIISFTTSISGSNRNNNSNAQKIDHHHISRSNVVKYHKLRNFFSSRSPTATAATRGGTQKGKSFRSRSTRVDHHHHHNHYHHDGSSSRICRSITDENKNTNDTGSSDDQKGCLVNLDELDPPLPVVKVVRKQEEGRNGERMNLWKRRSGGAPLKSLQLQFTNRSQTLLSANTV